MSVERFSIERYQPLWVLINSTCKIFDSFVMLQITVAWIFNGCVFYFFRRATTRFFTAILLFYLTCFFYFNMEIMRESMAVAMFLVAIIKYNDRRFFGFYSWLAAAALFHKFALLLLITPFILTRRIPTWLKVLASLSLIIWLGGLQNPLSYIESFGGALADLDLKFYEVDSELSLLGLIYNLLRIIPVILVMLWYRNRPLPSALLRREVIFPLCWAFVLIIIVRILSIPFLDRVSNYFVFFVLCILVSALGDIVERQPLTAFRVPIVTSASVIGLLFYVLPLMAPDPKLGDIPSYRRYFPYYSVFSMQTDSDREHVISIEAKE
ncbi:EpsG family protein [Paracidovorax wautersii]|uniref:EpsG family protein n=2 Tax=Paracidovorax wautersii TaxID=1177982 RepID=A0A1I2CLB5_9BURK|nr:EpsG family protein [Paracidovorax wautersii]